MGDGRSRGAKEVHRQLELWVGGRALASRTRAFLLRCSPHLVHQVSAEEKNTFKPQLAAASGFISEAKVDAESYFKASRASFQRGDPQAYGTPFPQVHWTKVPDLIDRRKVFIHRGQAYIQTKDELSLVSGEFCARLAKSLEVRPFP